MPKGDKQDGKDISPEDAALWAEMMEDVTPMPGVERPSAPDAPEVSAPKAKTIRTPKSIKVPEPTPASAPLIGSGLDLNTRKSLERGQMPIEGIIDLHGHTREDGRSALTAFLLGAYHSGKRCVLVITGKGRLTKNEDKPWWDSKRGVLKAGFSEWVQEPPLDRIVLHTALARGKHGGGGAFYVLLRRQKA